MSFNDTRPQLYLYLYYHFVSLLKRAVLPGYILHIIPPFLHLNSIIWTLMILIILGVVDHSVCSFSITSWTFIIFPPHSLISIHAPSWLQHPPPSLYHHLTFISSSKSITISNQTPSTSTSTADWPLVLGLETPLRPEQKPTVHSLLSLNDKDLRYNVVKMLLTIGIPLVKHNRYVRTKRMHLMACDCSCFESYCSMFPPTDSTSLHFSTPLLSFRGMMGRSSKHLTTFRISDKEFFYTSRSDPSKPEDNCNKYSLFAIKFIREGALSDDVCALRKVQPAHCFEIITNSR